MVKGRKIDSNWRPRDAQGWIIPREGSVSRKVYDLMKFGSTTHTIVRLTGKPIEAIYRMRCRIMNPEKFKVWHREATRRKGQSHVSS